MIKLDKSARDSLKNIYTQFEDKDEIPVSSPNYKKTVIDYLVNQGLLEKLDASTLSGWAYIVRPTHSGEMLFSEILDLPLSKVEAFIKQGEVIMKEEYHHVTEYGIAVPDYIDGPKSDQWFSEISIFNSRYLKTHPLYDQIAKTCTNHKHAYSSHEDMMGFLKALAADNDYWMEIAKKEFTMSQNNTGAIAQILLKDIERCKQYFNNPSDFKAGKDLYIEITSRYDGIINGFGNGLYEFYEKGHFYNPDLSEESLKYNLTVLYNRMLSYQAMNYPVNEVNWRGGKTQMMYDVFVSHANADKLDYVNQLKQSLDKLQINVFYDKDTLEWGDRWKDKILEGVNKAEFAIIVISENFFGREWTEKELKELLDRQNTSGQKIILPILHNISMNQLHEKYPAVADIQALNSDDYSCDEIALKFAGQLIKRLKS